MKLLWVVLLAFLCSCCPLRVKTPLLEDLSGKTAALVSPGDGGRYCAAVWIHTYRLLTAAHCVEDAGQSDLEALLSGRRPGGPVGQIVWYSTREDPSGMEIGMVVKYDEKDDLALIRTSTAHAFTDLRVDPVQMGEEVSLIGHPLGDLGWTYTHGYVSMLREDFEIGDKKLTRLQVNIDILPGDSGGGLFDLRGRLVGVCSFRINTGQGPAYGLGFFVPQHLIQRFLDGSP